MKILILIEPSIMTDFWAEVTINSYYQIISRKITNDVVIDHNNMLNNYINKNYIIITFSFNVYKYDIIDLLKKEKVILINVDYYTHFNFLPLLDIINNEKLNFTIFDYNPINLKEISKKYENIKIEYIPLLYNSYLEEHYRSHVNNHVNKDIDVLFYGGNNPRREYILEKLKAKYKVQTVHCNITGIPNYELCNYISRSKIVLNIYYYDHNKVFDYYRNSYLLANKALLISEYPDSIDFNIDRNLVNIDNYLIMGKYEKLVDLVSYYLDNYNNINVNDIVEKQYKWFSNHNLENLIQYYFSKKESFSKVILTNFNIEFKNLAPYLNYLNIIQKYYYDRISNINHNVTVTFIIPKNLLKTKAFTFYKCWKNGYCFNNSNIKLPKNLIKVILKKI